MFTGLFPAPHAFQKRRAGISRRFKKLVDGMCPRLHHGLVPPWAQPVKGPDTSPSREH